MTCLKQNSVVSRWVFLRVLSALYFPLLCGVECSRHFMMESYAFLSGHLAEADFSMQMVLAEVFFSIEIIFNFYLKCMHL